MLEVLKRIALETVDASQPVIVTFGSIKNVNPLTIMVDNRIELTREFFILTETIQNKLLEEGQSLVMIRFQGGQQYLVLDRVV